MKQKIFLIFSIFLLLTFFNNNLLLLAQSKVKTVVIDPGHGGSDPGAVGKFSKEKDLVLKMSLMFGDQIKKHFPDVKVIYTRTDDSHVELYKRAEIANKNNADLFISVHINSFKNNEPYGTETFVMGTSKNDANMQVAKLENSVILKEDNYQENYGGFDPNDPENHIVFSLYQNAYLTQSLLLAQLMQENFTGSLKRFDRGVKQDGFLVLWKTTMPSILVELGFISNIEEEKYLNSDIGQKDLAKAMFDAFVSYKSHYDEEEYKISNIEDTIKTSNPSGNTNSETPTNLRVTINTSELRKEKNPNPNVVVKTGSTEGTTSSDKADSNTTSTFKVTTDKDQIVYKIQIGSSTQKTAPTPKNFKNYQNVEVYYHNGMYKYTIGSETDRNKIMELHKEVKEDFKDSFIVKFRNGERI